MSAGNGQNGTNGHGAGGVRVVLLGPSKLERPLRRVPGIELVRAPEAHRAIGEAADPIDADSPARTVVLVAPGMVPSERAGAFAAAVKHVSPRARVLAIGEQSVAGFDGALPESSGAAGAEGDLELLERLVGGEAPEPRKAPSAAVPPVEAEPATPPAADAPPPDNGALEVVASLLKGHDPIESAMRGVRTRLGVANAAFVPAVRASGQTLPPTGGVPVVHTDRVLGHLVAPRADRAAVEAEAAGLALWVALAAQQEQLKQAAFVDELTGAWNRRYFSRFLGAAIEKARPARRPVTLLCFDIDDFKVYNDRYGHAAGDEILVETVKLLRSVIRPTDRVCRIGGDEFAVVFYDPEGPRDPSMPQPPANIGPIARRFQKQICEHRFPKLGDDAPGTLTVSGGMATFPWDGGDVEQLLERADQLALQSKRVGKNAITLGPGAERVCSLGDPAEA